MVQFCWRVATQRLEVRWCPSLSHHQGTCHCTIVYGSIRVCTNKKQNGACLQITACDSPVGRLGLTICYDLRFPELYQRLAFEQGAQIMLVPSAFTKVTGVRL